MYIGKTKQILKYLGFLVDKYNCTFEFQTFDEYKGFRGPIDAYSFYNNNGCFTIHNIVQKGEWGWYESSKFSSNQYQLLEKEINQSRYIYNQQQLLDGKNRLSQCILYNLSYMNVLKKLSLLLMNQIETTGYMFSIKITSKSFE